MTTDTPTKTAHTARARRRPLRKIDVAMRQRIEEAVERMIEALDALDAPDEDLEEDDPGGTGNEDDEPSLGATEDINQSRAWKATKAQTYHSLPDGEINLGTPGCYAPESYSQEYCAARFGSCDEREAHEDDEPSLGSIENQMDQTGWACGDDSDREGAPGDDDREPSLGATNGIDQAVAWRVTYWQTTDREEEHDGSEQDEDSEPSLASPEWTVEFGAQQAGGSDDREQDDAPVLVTADKPNYRG